MRRPPPENIDHILPTKYPMPKQYNPLKTSTSFNINTFFFDTHNVCILAENASIEIIAIIKFACFSEKFFII